MLVCCMAQVNLTISFSFDEYKDIQEKQAKSGLSFPNLIRQALGLPLKQHGKRYDLERKKHMEGE